MPEHKKFKFDLYNSELGMHPLYTWRILVEKMRKNYDCPSRHVEIKNPSKKLTHALEALLERGLIKKCNISRGIILKLTESGRGRYRTHKRVYEETGSYYFGHTI